MELKNKKIIALTVIFVLVLGTAVIYVGGILKNNNENEIIMTSKDSEKVPVIALNLSEKEAIDMAMEVSGGGTVVEYSVKNRRYEAKHEIEILNGKSKYEIKIDDNDSEIIEYEKDRINGSRDENYIKDLVLSSKINIDDAKKKVMEKTGGGLIFSYELHVNNGKLYYDIEVANGVKKH